MFALYRAYIDIETFGWGSPADFAWCKAWAGELWISLRI